MKKFNKRELQQTTFNLPSDINFKEHIKLYKDSANESFSFLVNNKTLPLDNPLSLGNVGKSGF